MIHPREDGCMCIYTLTQILVNIVDVLHSSPLCSFQYSSVLKLGLGERETGHTLFDKTQLLQILLMDFLSKK